MVCPTGVLGGQPARLFLRPAGFLSVSYCGCYIRTVKMSMSANGVCHHNMAIWYHLTRNMNPIFRHTYTARWAMALAVDSQWAFQRGLRPIAVEMHIGNYYYFWLCLVAGSQVSLSKNLWITGCVIEWIHSFCHAPTMSPGDMQASVSLSLLCRLFHWIATNRRAAKPSDEFTRAPPK